MSDTTSGVLSIKRVDHRAMPVADIRDVLDIERVPLSAREIPATTYEMLKTGAALAPDSPALSFFAEAQHFKKATVWTHRELFRRITQAANLFRRLGVERGDVVAFVLPNLPETHLTIWGGEAAGIAFAISPLQDTEQIAALLAQFAPKIEYGEIESGRHGRLRDLKRELLRRGDVRRHVDCEHRSQA